MKKMVAIAMILLSGCACEKAQNPEMCRVVKRVVITSAVISASAALYESCRDRSSYREHDVHIPTAPNCNSGACR